MYVGTFLQVHPRSTFLYQIGRDLYSKRFLILLSQCDSLWPHCVIAVLSCLMIWVSQSCQDGESCISLLSFVTRRPKQPDGSQSLQFNRILAFSQVKASPLWECFILTEPRDVGWGKFSPKLVSGSDGKQGHFCFHPLVPRGK